MFELLVILFVLLLVGGSTFIFFSMLFSEEGRAKLSYNIKEILIGVSRLVGLVALGAAVIGGLIFLFS